VDALRDRESKERDVALAAARTLGDAGAGPEARAAAAAALRTLADQKEERLKG
jgi:hypothetical protein